MAGLTRREQFAMAAMQGMLAVDYPTTVELIANDAVRYADALIEALRDDEWAPWDGGERPVTPDKFVDVKFRSGGVHKGKRAFIWNWKHNGNPDDIVEYRISKGVAK